MRTLTTIFFFSFLAVCSLAQAQSWQQLDSLGRILIKQQKHQAADSVLRKASKVVEELHGKDSNYVSVLEALGKANYFLKKYEYAEKIWLDGKTIVSEKYGTKNRIYANLCWGLGHLNNTQNRFNLAEEYFIETKKIKEEIFGKYGMASADCNNDLGLLYSTLGKYDQAEPLYLEAIKIREQIFGKRNQDYIIGLNNLALLYAKQGLYDKAMPLFEEAKETREMLTGKKNAQYALSCNNLGLLYKKKGDFGKAEQLLQEAKMIREELLGKKHPDYAISCSNLGNLYAEYKLYDKAKPLQLETMKIKGEVAGTKSPLYANACGNLAALYHQIDSVYTALALYQEALKIFEYLGLTSHPDYISTLDNFAVLHLRMDSLEKARPIFKQVAQNKTKEVETLLPIYSEQEKQAYWQSIGYFFAHFADFCASYIKQNPTIAADLYDQTLFTKAIIFSSTQKMKNAILNSGDTVLINQFNNWKKQRETYTKLYQLPLEEQKKQNLDLEAIKKQINELEKDLSKKSALFGQNVQTKSYKWQEVKTKLAKNEAVIEIIKSDSAYIALFLTAQTENYPVFHIFKNALDLETKYLNFYKNCIEFKIEDTVSYNAFWKPIADKLLTLNKKGFKKIYFSPDGVFHQLSLNTLKNTKTGKFLLEEANIQLIGSSRDLIELNKKSRDLSQNYENYQAHLLGYPIYGAENTEKEPEKKRDRSLGFSGMQSAVGVAGAVSLLPGTKKEVENVFGLFNQKKLKVNLLLAENATEEAVKNLKSPTILHVATHGFFIPEIKDSEVQDMQTAMNRNLLKNPFLRSGLLLAGCQKPNPDKEDGILTAEEVMNLTLDNTELVVLSACETGLGDIQAGEGVFGLQRAFQQAGAKSVLMSLWKVDDDATQTLMTEFYTALLKGQSKRQAFKTAQMNLKKRFPEPYYWGAFVMVGE